MAAKNVESFAAELKLPVETLLEQLKAAGVKKTKGEDPISEADKEKLLEALRKAHGGSEAAPRKKITITKRQTSEIKQADGSGKSRTIQVEVRKKRVFVKRDETDASADAPAVEPSAPAIDQAELDRREAEAARQRELLARQEEARLAKLAAEEEARASAQAAEQAAASVAADQTPDAEATSPSAETAVADAESAGAAEAEPEKKSKVRKVTAQQATASNDARRAVEDEVAAINRLMNAARTGKLAATAKAPEPPKPEAKADTITLKTPVKKPGEESSDKPKDKKNEKSVKSSQLSSTWQEDGAKRRALKTRGDATGGTGGWRGGPKGRNRSSEKVESNFVAPTEPVIKDV
ncbi:MAG: translation initiation factor IF-2 associated domain-containing protein, partial [Burkholderiaceae bacterium]